MSNEWKEVKIKLETFKLAWKSYDLLESLGDRRIWDKTAGSDDYAGDADNA